MSFFALPIWKETSGRGKDVTGIDDSKKDYLFGYEKLIS
jgi:hypothetical protein